MRGKEIFVSHSSADFHLTKPFRDQIIIQGLGINEESIFCTIDAKTGIRAGVDIPEELKRKLKTCDLFICLLSHNYLKSPICLMELGSAWSRGVEIFPLLIPPLKAVDTNRLYTIRNLNMEPITNRTYLMSLSQRVGETLPNGLQKIVDNFVFEIQSEVEKRTKTIQKQAMIRFSTNNDVGLKEFLKRLLDEDLILGYVEEISAKANSEFEIYLSEKENIQERVQEIAEEMKLSLN